MDTERHQLEKEFAKNGIWYMPLKGSILKDWYPKFGMREMADNDILFDEKKRNDVKQIFQNRGYTVESYGKINDDAYESRRSITLRCMWSFILSYMRSFMKVYQCKAAIDSG